MRPLDPLAARSEIARLLQGAPAAEVRAALEALAALPLGPAEAAALGYARGALRLREGALDEARAELDAAADALFAIGEDEAALLARCEALLAAIRRGPRGAYPAAIAALEEARARAEAGGHRRAAVVALHYRGTAERFSGDAVATQRTLLEAFEKSGDEGVAGRSPLLEERAQILNSLGTLYVVLGAYGAARALLEHAAELAPRVGDAVGEAIAHGQLGSAALALGEIEVARRHLQKQEWLATRVGDSFGRARALTFLADAALDMGRPDEAAELAELALGVARGVTPPLALWAAYATRALGRARMDLGDLAAARAHLEAAHAEFTRFGNPLGQGLAAWDLARLAASEGREADWFAPAWALGSLGLPARVARLLGDRDRDRHHDQSAGGPPDFALAAAAQSAPHLAVAQEIDLVYGDPAALAAIASRRTAAQRNLGRLAALTLAPPGLVIAAVVSASIGAARRALPPERGSGAALLELPGAAVWGWPPRVTPEEVGRDLAALRAALGPDTRVALAWQKDAHVAAPPFPGEVGAALEGVAALELLAAARALEPATLLRDRAVPWSPEAEALTALAGLASRLADG